MAPRKAEREGGTGFDGSPESLTHLGAVTGRVGRRAVSAVPMDVRELQAEIEALAENPGDIKGKAGRAVDEVIAGLDEGRLRVCELPA